MKTIYSPAHLEHHAQGEFNRGALVPPYEKPQRAEWVREAVEQAAFGPLLEPRDFGLEPVLRVHDAGYVAFLQGAHAEWQALGRPGDAIPMAWPGRGMRDDRVPESLDGRLGHYSYDIGTPITPGTWEAVRTGANIALTATALVQGGERAAFACAALPATMPHATTWAATAISTMRPSRRSTCAITVPHGWRSSTSTTTMAMVPRASFTIATTCCSFRSTAIP